MCQHKVLGHCCVNCLDRSIASKQRILFPLRKGFFNFGCPSFALYPVWITVGYWTVGGVGLESSREMPLPPRRNFSGCCESAGARFTLDCPPPTSLPECESERKLSVAVLWECFLSPFFLIVLEGLLAVVWYLQPGIEPTEILFMYIAARGRYCFRYRACNIHALFFSDVNHQCVVDASVHSQS